MTDLQHHQKATGHTEFTNLRDEYVLANILNQLEPMKKFKEYVNKMEKQ